MPTWLAGAVVFFTSGSVLVLEILAGRLLAPYVGVRLETYTSVIGIVLGGIALGTWLGGRLADRVDPRKTVGPLMVAGGGLAIELMAAQSSKSGRERARRRCARLLALGCDPAGGPRGPWPGGSRRLRFRALGSAAGRCLGSTLGAGWPHGEAAGAPRAHRWSGGVILTPVSRSLR